jgi:hypothetical protein
MRDIWRGGESPCGFAGNCFLQIRAAALSAAAQLIA